MSYKLLSIFFPEPLTIIRQGPGQVRTIIPVQMGHKTGTTSTVVGTTGTNVSQIAKIAAQSSKVNKVIQSGTKVRIVTPNASLAIDNKSAGELSSVAGSGQGDLADGKNVISNSPAFAGGTTIIRKVDPKVSVGNVTKVTLPVVADNPMNNSRTSADKELKSEENSNSSSMSSETDNEKTKKDSSDSSWSLPPIDMKAIKLPQKLDTTVSSDGKTKVKKSSYKSKAKAAKKGIDIGGSFSSPGPTSISAVPKFSLAESSSDSNMSAENQSPGMIQPEQNMGNQSIPQQPGNSAANLPTRPSDIDLHEMKLTENAFSSKHLSDMGGNSAVSRQNQPQWQNSNIGNQYQSKMPQNEPFSNRLPKTQPVLPTESNTSSGGFFNPGLPDSAQAGQGSNSSNQMMPQGSGMMGQQQNQGHMYKTNNQMYNQNAMPNMFGSFGSQNYPGTQSASNLNQNTGFGNQNPGFSGLTKSSSFPSQQNNLNNDNMADFTMSGIHNNSSFLSELTDADDNFLSQLGDNSSQSGHSSTMDSSQNSADISSVGNFAGSSGMGATGTGTQSSMMESQPGNMVSQSNMGSQSSNMGSQFGSMGMQPGYPQQSGGMNFDMFSQPQNQQKQGFFPNFGNNQFNRSSNFGGQQNMNMPQQGGFPPGNMYPMGGMMQPGMFPYPAFAPYPYPTMMAPMPYYPMPFQPQYGGQGPNMGQQGGSIGGSMGQPTGNMGMPMGQQGDSGFHSGMGN